MGKGELTKSSILDAALEVASLQGLEGLSIGPLAERVGLSKSGLYAHFRSKEGLQLAVLGHARDQFVSEVVVPALSAPRGEPRIRTILERWLGWACREDRVRGCLFIQSASEFDDRPGAVRDLLVSIQKDWIEDIMLAVTKAQDEGHFRSELDPAQFAHELYAVILAHHFHVRLLNDPETPERTRKAFQTLLEGAR